MDSLADIFKSDDEKRQRKLAEIAAEEQETERRRGIVMRALMLAGRIPAAEQQFARLVEPIDAGISLDQQDIYRRWLAHGGTAGSPFQIADLGALLASHEAVLAHAVRLKQFLYSQTVEIAQKALADYRAENAEVLNGITLKAVEAPPFQPLELKPLHYHDGTSTALIKKAISPK